MGLAEVEVSHDPALWKKILVHSDLLIRYVGISYESLTKLVLLVKYCPSTRNVI